MENRDLLDTRAIGETEKTSVEIAWPLPKFRFAVPFRAEVTALPYKQQTRGPTIVVRVCRRPVYACAGVVDESRALERTHDRHSHSISLSLETRVTRKRYTADGYTSNHDRGRVLPESTGIFTLFTATVVCSIFKLHFSLQSKRESPRVRATGFHDE